MSTVQNSIESGNVKFIVLVESSKLQLIAAPRLLVEAFKTLISNKMKLAKSKVKSFITASYCITEYKGIQLTKV